MNNYLKKQHHPEITQTMQKYFYGVPISQDIIKANLKMYFLIHMQMNGAAQARRQIYPQSSPCQANHQFAHIGIILSDICPRILRYAIAVRHRYYRITPLAIHADNNALTQQHTSKSVRGEL